MRRRATITFSIKKGTKTELVHETIWIQNIKPEDIQNNSIILKLFRDQDNNAVITTNNNDKPQYQVSLPIEDGAYAYIPVDAMKALLALNSVRTLNANETWVRLVLDPIQPSHSVFNSGVPLREL